MGSRIHGAPGWWISLGEATAPRLNRAMLDFIALPSGLIINLAQIAFLSPAGSQLAVNFAIGTSRDALQVNLDGADAAALLDALGQRRVNTNPTRKAMGT